MSDVATEETNQTQQETEAQAEADFNKGFGAVPEQSAPEAKPAEKKDDAPAAEEHKAEDKPTDTTEAKAEPAAKPDLVAGLTEEQWTAEVQKRVGPVKEQLLAEIRRSFGQYGELKRSVQEMKAALSAGKPGRKITADLLKRVNEELPGLGNALAADLSEILGGAEDAQASAEAKGEKFDPEKYFSEKLTPAFQDMEARINERAELRIVRSVHRDFDTVVKSDEFKKWLGALPADRSKAIAESEDGLVAADAVTEFKAYAEKAKKEKDKKDKRLETAVTPRGVPTNSVPNPTDDEADFNAGFKKADRKYAR